MRLPATAAGLPPQASGRLTTAPPRPQAPLRPVGPVTHPGPLGFVEEAGTQSAPVLTMENADTATVIVVLSGPKTYRQTIPPGSVVQLEIEPGFYQAQVRSTKLGSVPNRGTGEFRAFRRYYAQWRSVYYTQATPLRLGEQATDQAAPSPDIGSDCC